MELQIAQDRDRKDTHPPVSRRTVRGFNKDDPPAEAYEIQKDTIYALHLKTVVEGGPNDVWTFKLVRGCEWPGPYETEGKHLAFFNGETPGLAISYKDVFMKTDSLGNELQATSVLDLVNLSVQMSYTKGCEI